MALIVMQYSGSFHTAGRIVVKHGSGTLANVREGDGNEERRKVADLCQDSLKRHSAAAHGRPGKGKPN